jgi:hypothetical protein
MDSTRVNVARLLLENWSGTLIQKWAYWISTSLVAAMYIAGSAFYLSDIAAAKQAYMSLGYPGYLVPLLVVLKFLGGLAILLRFSVALSDLAYAGIFYHLLLAASAHINAGDGQYVPAVIGLLLLLLSFFTQNAARAKKSPYGSLASLKA